jgi:hypothetical protein
MDLFTFLSLTFLRHILFFPHVRPTFSKGYEVQGWAQSCMTPKIVRQYNMAMSPMGLGTKNDCADEGR